MLPKEQYIKTVRRPYPPFFGTLIMRGVANPLYFIDFLDGREYAVRHNIQSDHSWYYSKKELEDSCKMTFNHWSNPEKLEQAKNIFYQREQKLIEATKKDLADFVEAYQAYMPALMLVWFADPPLDKKINELMHHHLPANEAERLLSALNIPEQDNYYKKEELSMATTDDLEAHVKEYEWINSRYGDVNPYTIEEARKRKKEINTQDLLRKWNDEKAALRQSVKRAKEILEKNSHYIDFMQFIIYYRTQRTDIMNKASYLFAPTLEKIAREKDLTYEQLLHCTVTEVETQIPSSAIIMNRIKDHAIVVFNGQMQCVSGYECDQVREHLKGDVDESEELKGAVAYKGTVRGYVKILEHGGEYENVKDGDILVTSMTTPDMIQIMKKAAAFVTDEGGITCHAAIIAREMKKPCIIGTKIATNVLKDGDIVEVNAQDGIVKILTANSKQQTT